MAELTIYGASDDLVEVEGVVEEEFPGEDVTLLVAGVGRQAKVRVRYERGGVWSIAYLPADEDIDGFDGRVDINSYTARLTLDVDGATAVYRLEATDA